MARGTVIKHVRKAGAFVDGELAAGEWGLDVTNGNWYFSRNGTTVELLSTGGGGGGDADTLDGQDGTFYLARANHTGTQAISTVSGLQTALDDKVDDSEKGAANGIATLDGNSKIPTSQMPALALTDVHVVADEAAILALTAEEGDVAVQTDTGQTWIHNGGTAGTMANWTEIGAIGQVTSVNGQQGVVVLSHTDVGAAAASHTHNASDINAGDLATARMSTNVAAALNASPTATINNANLTLDAGTL